MLFYWEQAAWLTAGALALAWRRWGERAPEIGRPDAALLILLLLGGILPSLLFWDDVAHYMAPSGADYEGYYFSALAMESGDWAHYALDRYPGYPWLVSVFSPSSQLLHVAGAWISRLSLALMAVPLYFLGRELGGRAAGFWGALLTLRLSLVLDLGRTFTHYPLAASLGVLLLTLTLCWRRQALWVPPLAGLTGALMVSCDPKLFVFTLGLFGLLSLRVLLRSERAWWAVALLLGSLWLPLQLAHYGASLLPVELMSLEEVTTRVHLRFRFDPSIQQHLRDGYVLGGEGGWSKLLPSLLRTGTGVSPGETDQGFLSTEAVYGLKMVFGKMTSTWLLLPLALALSLAWRRPPGWWAKLGALGLLALVAYPILHLNYQHRYFLMVAVFLPTLILAGLQVWAGGAAVSGAAVIALLLSPLELSESYQERQSHKADVWVGKEIIIELQLQQWAMEELPPNTHLFDMAEFRVLTTLASVFPYTRCTRKQDSCASDMAAAWSSGKVPVANIFSGESLSTRLPGGPGDAIPRAEDGGGVPEQLGDCWEQVKWITPDNALYAYTCDRPPRQVMGIPTAPPPRPPPDGMHR